jgi:pimeloyl-ACP methyl ester carboxylesterase
VLTSFAGSDIFGEAYGAGVPGVLALHGWRRDHTDFAQTLKGGDVEVAAIAVDFPGFGGTPPPEEVWGSPEYAAALDPIVGAMADRFIVLGHSFGGRVAVHLASRHPDRVVGMVLTGVPLYRASASPSKAPLPVRVVKHLAGRGLLPAEVLEKYRERYGSADYRAAEGIVRDILVKTLNETYDEAVGRVRCPVELVWGEDDTAVPLAVAERIAAELPGGANLVVLPGVDHMTPTAAPEQLRLAIERLRT